MHDHGATRPMEPQPTRERPHQDPHETIRDEHRRTLWIPWTVVALGVWLLLAPWAFGYSFDGFTAVPSGGRGVWNADGTLDELRASLATWSDVVSGGLLVGLGWRMLRPGRPRSWWAACFVGIWLIFAPVVLWAPTPAAYVNDSLIGMLLVALTVLIPGMPNMPAFMVMGPNQPPGWSYNPSSWPQRAILAALALVGLLVSRYLAAFQLGYIDTVWDPFFGFDDGAAQVLNSDLSHTWPVSDAALGAVAYTFEFLMVFMGGTARWRTMPWMVTIFGILVIPLGLAHITLVMSQPVAVHYWCTLCLLAAAVMLPMIPLEVDEVVAMAQHVRTAKRHGDRGGSTWKIFWLGGTAEGSRPDERTPPLVELPERPKPVLRAMVWGFTSPWPLVVSAVLGLWLLAAPSVFDVDIRSPAADLAHIIGAGVVVLAVVAMGEVLRALRLLNVVAGVALAVGALLVEGPMTYRAAVVVTGLAVLALAVPRGRISEAYSTWSRLIV